MRKCFFSFFHILSTFHGIAQNAFETIPLKVWKNYLFLEVKINNHNKPLLFLFDSGAGITVLNTKLANQLGLIANRETKINTSGKSLLSKESVSNSVKIGNKAVLENINLIFMDLSHISDYLNISVDGVIGFDLLNAFVTETNIDEKKMLLYHPNTYTYQGKEQPLSLTTLESNLFGIFIEVTPKKAKEPLVLNFQIDTGADNYLSFHSKTVEKHQLINNKKKQQFRKGFGADSTIVTNIKSSVQSVSFAGKKWKNTSVMLEVDPINARKNSLADGLIGQKLLLDFNIIYNLSKKQVYFEKRH